MKIVFIQAGGSIDKDYFPTKDNHGYNFEIKDPAVKSILLGVDPNFKFEIIEVIKKDSLDMDDNDRQKIYDICQKIQDDKIIITHGTDRFTETAKKLSAIKDKIIILTGARRPEKFDDSDADFNVGVAVGAISYLESGVYIAMGGKVHPWDKY